MKILIIGAGMYVTGRNQTGTGTILASCAEVSKHINIDSVTVIAKSKSNHSNVLESINNINAKLNTSLKVEYKSLGNNYLEEMNKICKAVKYDCVIISVPDHLHFEYAKFFLTIKIPCLVVKPLTPTLKEAKELVELQQKNNILATVEFHKRYDETNLYIKRVLTEKKLGQLLYFTVDYSQKINVPSEIFREWSSQTNIFQYLGVHYVDLIYFLTGFLPIKLCAYGTEGILKQRNIDTYDSIHAMIVWENKADKFISQFTTNWIDPTCTTALSDQKYKVIGTKGRIECNQTNRGIEMITESAGIQSVNPYFSDYLPDENNNLKFGGYGYKSIEIFLKDVINIKNNLIDLGSLEKIRPTFEQSLVSTAVIDAVNQSLINKSEWRVIDDIFK